MITPDHFLSVDAFIKNVNQLKLNKHNLKVLVPSNTDGEETWDWQNIPGVHVGDRTSI